MRIGMNTVYTNMTVNQQNTQDKLVEISKKLSSGKKIQFGYEDSSVFTDTLRLDYEKTMATQSKEISERARQFSDNTDTVLTQMSLAMDNFKQKLIHASNEVHSEESLLALANDMRSIKDHMESLANTTVGGQYIFSGSKVNTVPIADDGTYQGNGEEMKALVGSNSQLVYNINGEDLFLGKDSDVQKKITTNIKHYNMELLHPEIMSDIEKDKVPEEVFITATDTLRGLLGDNNDDTSDYGKDGNEYFYMRGRKPDGTYVQTKFSLEVAYDNETSATKVQDLLDRIGKEFGNSTLSKVVDVQLNNWGQIEIRDLNAGSSLLDFHMVSSTDDVDDIDDLLNNGDKDTKITEYVKSNFYATKNASDITAENDQYDHRLHRFQTTLKRDDNSIVKVTDSLTSIFGPDSDSITVHGTDTAGNSVASTISFSGNTIQDLLTQIENDFSATSGDVEAYIANGQIYMIDNTLENEGGLNDTYSGTSQMSVSLRTHASTSTVDTDASSGSTVVNFNSISGLSVGDKITFENQSEEYEIAAIDTITHDVTLTTALSETVTSGSNIYTKENGLSNDFTVEYDRVRAEKNGAKLISNNSQVVIDTNEFATSTNTLREVAGPTDDTNITMDGESYTVEMKDISGTRLEVQIDFATAGTTYTINDLDNNVNYGPLNLYDPYTSSDATPADEVTYQQLTDVLSVAMNFSNLVAAGSEPTSTGVPDDDVEAYKDALNLSYRNVEVKLDYKGRLIVQDLTSAQTSADIAIYNTNNQSFGTDSYTHTDKGLLTFNTSNALIIDEPYIDLFEQLETAIEAVENKILRPDGYNSEVDFDYYTRNPGIQNSMDAIDHISEHIYKLHAKNGSQGDAFQYSIEKYEVQIVQIQTLNSKILDADIAQTSMEFSQLTLNYQAMLQSVSRINSLSLVNFL